MAMQKVFTFNNIAAVIQGRPEADPASHKCQTESQECCFSGVCMLRYLGIGAHKGTALTGLDNLGPRLLSIHADYIEVAALTLLL
jgi:hypothetical protein